MGVVTPAVNQPIPTERIILLVLMVASITCLIFYVLFLIGKEFMRRFNIWVIQRARYLEEQQQQHHHHHHRKPSPRPSSSKGGAVRRPGKGTKKKDDSYSGSSSSDDNSNSYSD